MIVIAFLLSEVIFTLVGESKFKGPVGSQTVGLFFPVTLLIVVLRNLENHLSNCVILDFKFSTESSKMQKFLFK